MRSPVMLHELGRISEDELNEMKIQDDNDFVMDDLVYYEVKNDEIIINGDVFDTQKGNSKVIGITVDKFGMYDISITMKSELGALAQLPVSVFYDNALKAVITIQGSEGAWVNESRPLGFVFGKNHYIKFYFGASGLTIDQVVIRLVNEVKLPF